MAKVYRSAMGHQVNIENLMLQNETVIAVGNQKVNARGDQLGPGGKIVKTRDQIMKEYYSLNTPVATEIPIPVQKTAPQKPAATQPQPIVAASHPVQAPLIQPEPINALSGLDEVDDGPATQPVIDVAHIPEPTPVTAAPVQPVVRGSLASSVAKDVVITQTPALPANKANGIQRF